MVVIGIMAILMSVGIPAFSSWAQNYRLKAASRDIYSNFQRARLEAIKSNCNVVVAFNAAAGRYQVFIDNGGTTGTANDDTLNGDELIINTVSMPSQVTIAGVNFSGGSTTPGFTGRGLPISDRVGNVQLTNANGRWYKITLNFAGGLRLEVGKDTNGDGVADDWI